MPVVYKKVTDDYTFGLWLIQESMEELTLDLILSEKEERQLEKFGSVLRKKQWIVTRALTSDLLRLKKGATIEYDQHGKPFIPSSTWKISISHSGAYVGVMLSNKGEVGMDLEYADPRILGIAPRFLNDEEYERLRSGADPIEKITVAWSAKESVYKLLGSGKFSFSKDLMTAPFDLATQGSLLVEVSESGFLKGTFLVNFEKGEWEGYATKEPLLLTWVLDPSERT